MKKENSWLTADTRVLGHPVLMIYYIHYILNNVFGCYLKSIEYNYLDV
jgi:hypothetical protein